MINFRAHKKSDIEYRVAWLNNPKINKYIGQFPGQKTTLAKQKEWFKKYEQDKSKKFFTICDDKKPIGFMGFSGIDKVNRNANIFIAIGDDDYRGKGIGKNALEWLIDYGFKKLKLHKINLGVFEKNICAIHLYKKFGFVVEGILKDEVFFDGKYHNQILMAKFDKS